jgi:hypothetical protein
MGDDMELVTNTYHYELKDINDIPDNLGGSTEDELKMIHDFILIFLLITLGFIPSLIINDLEN